MSDAILGSSSSIDITFIVCLKCGCRIDTGLCDYTCDYDALGLTERPKDMMEYRTYHRTDVLVEILPFDGIL